MELHPQEWGGHNRLKLILAGGALAIAGIVKAGALLINGNKRTPTERGGWRPLDTENL